MRYLLDRGGDPVAAVGVLPDSKGLTPLHVAAVPGHCEAVRLLLSKGVDLDAISSCGTPLHMAASKDQDQALNILLDHGADKNIPILDLLQVLFSLLSAVRKRKASPVRSRSNNRREGRSRAWLMACEEGV